ncbi:MAG: hypothetical protein H6755_00975 [Candidatus Omnitrophica bacterium]|nr:hypothetical protein [Candidatus Omnitrophota bacterium]MCB9746962.1 hypothetical protein [Candidatus Omnitrophota bacterium]
MTKLQQYLILAAVIIIGFMFLNKNESSLKSKQAKKISEEVVVLSNFEDPKVWGISPEHGFSIRVTKKHSTQGKYSLEVKFPQKDYPSINTKKLEQNWGDYEYLLLDVFNPQDESIDFRIRLDDLSKKRVNIPYRLEPGANVIKIAKSQIAAKINAEKIRFVVFYLNDPRKRLTLYFDNLRLEKSGLIQNIETKLKNKDTVQTQASAQPLPLRKAVDLPSKPVLTQGELKVALAKLKDEKEKVVFISSGIPFARGQLKAINDFVITDTNGQEIPIAAKVLARWPQDQSIRSVLVQFQYPIEAIYEYVLFRWGVARTTKDLDIVEPRWQYPEGVVVMPAEWLCSSEVTGEQVPLGIGYFYDKYDKKILNNFEKVKNKPWTGKLTVDGFYSTPHVFYQLYARSGELNYFLAARKELLHYRDTQLILDGENRGRSTQGPKGRYVYVQAMMDDYLLTGDPKSLEVARYMAEYLKNYFPPEKAFYPKGAEYFWTERTAAFPFLGIITYYELTQDKEYLKLADEYMENLYKMQMQYPERGGFIHNLYAHDPEEGARKDEYGGSPFMTGLLLESIIKYHKITKSEKAADSIFRVVDWLINEGLVADGDSFKYMTADKYLNTDGDPDVNLLVVHGLGYAYRLSGYQNEEYIKVGQKVFNRGVKDGFVAKRKHFNQNFRNSGHYLAYVADGLEQLQVLKPLAEQDEERTIENVLFFEGFEYSLGKFKGMGDAALDLDKDDVYLNGNSFHIKSKFQKSTLSAGFLLENWNMDDFSRINFAYKIPSETPVGMLVITQFGDSICIGGTSRYQCGRTQAKEEFKLIDDGQWHEANFDVRLAVRSVLPQLKSLTGFQYFTNGNATEHDEFWIDDFKIRRE